MEDIIDVYELPYILYGLSFTLMNKPISFSVNQENPLLMREGSNQTIDSEYARERTCSIFLFTEPLSGVSHLNVRNRCTAIDWAEEIKYLADISYPDAEKIILILDNPNTHKIASLYKEFSPEEALIIAKHLEAQYTPKYGYLA